MWGEQFAQLADAGLTKLRCSSYGTASQTGQIPNGTPSCILTLPGRHLRFTNLVIFLPHTRPHVRESTQRGYFVYQNIRDGTEATKEWAGCRRGVQPQCSSCQWRGKQPCTSQGSWKAHQYLVQFPSSQSQEWPGEMVEARWNATNKQKDVLGWVFSRSWSVFSMHFYSFLFPKKIICRSANLRGFCMLPYVRGSRGMIIMVPMCT